jgi:hypothetical protein
MTFIVVAESIGQHRRAVSHDHHSSLRHVDFRPVAKVNPKRLEGFVVESIDQVSGAHRVFLMPVFYSESIAASTAGVANPALSYQVAVDGAYNPPRLGEPVQFVAAAL